MPPGPPCDLELLVLEKEKKEKPIEKTTNNNKVLRFSDMADEGPPGECVCRFFFFYIFKT